jgi:ATP/maltotriose-dependent transcriptional regulator MalT
MGGASDERWSCLGQAQRRARFLTRHELQAHVSARTVLDDHHLEEAQALIREAVRMVPSDMLDLRALLHVNLAKVVAASGRDDLARSITDEAVGLYERKGNLVTEHVRPGHRQQSFVRPDGRGATGVAGRFPPTAGALTPEAMIS